MLHDTLDFFVIVDCTRTGSLLQWFPELTLDNWEQSTDHDDATCHCTHWKLSQPCRCRLEECLCNELLNGWLWLYFDEEVVLGICTGGAYFSLACNNINKGLVLFHSLYMFLQSFSEGSTRVLFHSFGKAWCYFTLCWRSFTPECHITPDGCSFNPYACISAILQIQPHGCV